MLQHLEIDQTALDVDHVTYCCVEEAAPSQRRVKPPVESHRCADDLAMIPTGIKQAGTAANKVPRRERAQRMATMVAMTLNSSSSKRHWANGFKPLSWTEYPVLDRARCDLFMASICLDDGIPLVACESTLYQAIEVFRSNHADLEEGLAWAQIALLNAACGTLYQVKAAALRALEYPSLPPTARFRLLCPLVDALLAFGETDQLRRTIARHYALISPSGQDQVLESGPAYCGLAYMHLWIAVEHMGLRTNAHQHLPNGTIGVGHTVGAAAAHAIAQAEACLRRVSEGEPASACTARMLWAVLHALTGQLERGLSVLSAGPRAPEELVSAEAGIRAFMFRIHGRFAEALAALDDMPEKARHWRLLWAHCLYERSLCLQHLGDFCGAHGAMSACAQLNAVLRRSPQAIDCGAIDEAGAGGCRGDAAADLDSAGPAYLRRAVRLMSSGTLPWADMSIDAVAKAVGVSRRTLQAALRNHRSCSFTELRREIRMRDAVRLLRDTDLTVEIIAEQLGYTTRSLFYADFRAAFGQAPLSFRRAPRARLNTTTPEY